MRLIVFTDLDGTLLDHDSYSFEEANSALKRLKNAQVPLILTTSKTWAEVRALQQDLAIDYPCIVENGSAIFMGKNPFATKISSQDVQVFGLTYEEVCLNINQLPQNIRACMTGFADMTAAQVAENTGLSIEKATLAKERLASEPFLWSGNEAGLEELKELLDQKDLGLLQGGRFYHVLSKVDKRLAIEWMMERLKEQGETYHACALGDGPNDLEMIGAADTGVVIKNPKGVALKVENAKGTIVYTDQAGPKGWNVAIHHLMDELGLD